MLKIPSYQQSKSIISNPNPLKTNHQLIFNPPKSLQIQFFHKQFQSILINSPDLIKQSSRISSQSRFLLAQAINVKNP